VNAEPTCRRAVTRVDEGRAELDLTVALPDGTVTVRCSAVVAFPDLHD
jgi:hypothetical protein